VNMSSGWLHRNTWNISCSPTRVNNQTPSHHLCHCIKFQSWWLHTEQSIIYVGPMLLAGRASETFSAAQKWGLWGSHHRRRIHLPITWNCNVMCSQKSEKIAIFHHMRDDYWVWSGVWMAWWRNPNNIKEWVWRTANGKWIQKRTGTCSSSKTLNVCVIAIITDLLVTTERDHQLHKHQYSCHEHCTLL
jgi:hypothetical protein